MFAAQCCPARVDALCRRRHQKASAVARTASLASTSPCLDVLEASLPWTAGFTQHFLRTYWQKKPCLLRGALPTNYAGLLNADELAGLACDEEAESRLIVERGGARPWELVRSHPARGGFGELTLAAHSIEDRSKRAIFWRFRRRTGRWL